MTRWLRLDQEGFVVSRWWRFTPAPMSFRQPDRRVPKGPSDDPLRFRFITSSSVDSEGGQPVV